MKFFKHIVYLHLQIRTALSETVAMDRAVEKAMETLGDDLDDTLLLVTADHSHTMTISGYPDRGNSIIGTKTNMLVVAVV